MLALLATKSFQQQSVVLLCVHFVHAEMVIFQQSLVLEREEVPYQRDAQVRLTHSPNPQYWQLIWKNSELAAVLELPAQQYQQVGEQISWCFQCPFVFEP